MKKLAILLLFLFCATPIMAQQWKMHVRDTNGTELSYDVDSVSKMTFTNGALPYYYEMYYFGDVIPYPFPFLVSGIDSILFADTLGNQFFSVYSGGYPPYYPQGFYPIYKTKNNGFDSLTFPEFETDTNVVQLPFTFWDSVAQYTYDGSYPCAAWIGNRIYCGATFGPDRFFELDSNLDTIEDVIFDSQKYVPYCLAVDSSSSHLISVGGTYGGGQLQEYEIQTGSYKVLDSAYSISNAVYYRGEDDTIIFYTYGGMNIAAGYYLFDRKADTNILLLKYISDLGISEMVNGFDVSPDGKMLLLGSTSDFRPPLFIEYDLADHTLDTLPVTFDTATVNPALWVRYSHSGTKILYSNYPFYAFDPNDPVNFPSEIGIVDRGTGSRRVLETNPTNQGKWVGIFPEWSPDDASIVYSCGELATEPPGYVDLYQICILKTLQ